MSVSYYRCVHYAAFRLLCSGSEFELVGDSRKRGQCLTSIIYRCLARLGQYPRGTAGLSFRRSATDSTYILARRKYTFFSGIQEVATILPLHRHGFVSGFITDKRKQRRLVINTRV